MKSILKALHREAEALEERARLLLTGARAARELIETTQAIEAGTEKPAKVNKTEEKEPRQSPTRGRKKKAKGKARRDLPGRKPWTQEQKDRAAAARAARKAAARSGPAAVTVSAHDALASKSQSEVEQAAREQGIPERPRNGNGGTLAGLNQREAIKAVLRKAARQLTAEEILDRLTVGGYRFNSQQPGKALSVALATYQFSHERRAGRNYYNPITHDSGGNAA